MLTEGTHVKIMPSTQLWHHLRLTGAWEESQGETKHSLNSELTCIIFLESALPSSDKPELGWLNWSKYWCTTWCGPPWQSRVGELRAFYSMCHIFNWILNLKNKNKTNIRLHQLITIIDGSRKCARHLLYEWTLTRCGWVPTWPGNGVLEAEWPGTEVVPTSLHWFVCSSNSNSLYSHPTPLASHPSPH